jgi:hypothetical protein
MPDFSLVIKGKKFMWDGIVYKTKEEALDKMQKYKNDGFEVELLEEEDQYLLYTRRVVKEVVVDDKQ